LVDFINEHGNLFLEGIRFTLEEGVFLALKVVLSGQLIGMFPKLLTLLDVFIMASFYDKPYAFLELHLLGLYIMLVVCNTVSYAAQDGLNTGDETRKLSELGRTGFGGLGFQGECGGGSSGEAGVGIS
jgi:hypothetical protein